jgi:hypothetical protein
MFANWTVDGAQNAFHGELVELANTYPKSQNFKTTFHKYITCIFLLSVRNNSKIQFAM